MRIAIQGFTGSFHAIAAEKYFGSGHELIMCDSFPNLFKSLNLGEADCAVMAIENTIAGTILFNYALLRNSPFTITGETFLRIEHCLLALPGQGINDIKEVRSHPMALMQCMQFFSKYPHIKLIEDIDTAYMAELIAKNETQGVAAIAGEGVAKRFGLQILKYNIEDSERNFTRFLIIENRNSGQINEKTINKASICFSLPHQIGALKNVITELTERKINIMTFQSTPYVGNEWEYFFYTDIEFDEYNLYKSAIKNLEPLTINLKILGQYKKGI